MAGIYSDCSNREIIITEASAGGRASREDSDFVQRVNVNGIECDGW